MREAYAPSMEVSCPADSRRARRRRRREAREVGRQVEAQREAHLRDQLGPGERVAAYQRGHLLDSSRATFVGIMLTDHRVLFAWDLWKTPDERAWFSDAIPLDEVSRWSVGHRHDGRPMVRLDHPAHLRREQVTAHNVLWFHWGNALRDVSHDGVTFAFSSGRDPVFRAIRERLRSLPIPAGGDFREDLGGTRRTRTAGSVVYLRPDGE